MHNAANQVTISRGSRLDALKQLTKSGYLLILAMLLIPPWLVYFAYLATGIELFSTSFKKGIWALETITLVGSLGLSILCAAFIAFLNCLERSSNSE